jgi:signal transduction histidine kinase
MVTSHEIFVSLIAGTCLLVLLALILIFAGIRYQNKKRLYLIEEQRLKYEAEREILKARLETHEETLEWLTKEIRENIGQLLSSSKMLIGAAERVTPLADETLQMANNTLTQAIQELRAMSKSLRTEWLEKFSLISNIQSEIGRIHSTNPIEIRFEHPVRISLNGDRQLLLFRIIQEAFQNAIHHRKASGIKIKLSESGSKFLLCIEDKSAGFDVADYQKGSGMMNIQHRVEIMNGKVKWLANEKGTKLEVLLPV